MHYKIIIGVLSLSYPFIVYWGLQNYGAALLLPLLFILLSLRWITGNQPGERKVLIFSAFALLLVVVCWGQALGLKFYPVIMNLGFLTLFAGSLFSSMTVVERLARIKEPDLSDAGIAYTRKVTVVWSVFFLINGTVAAITAVFFSNEIWVFYNGFIAYLLIGILATAEWFIRKKVRHN
ncbi:COG4648 family protein [Aliamphritea ceti]|uniref:COG4648 family protein n=1 Tax=Aliamphritea ceti TaxID=1524258 RepID=UPI0021C3425A|nr:hypothetical protein [Aliamphritea ceti]